MTALGLLNVYSTRNLGDGAIYSALAKLSPTGRALAVLPQASSIRTPGLELVPELPSCTSFVGVGGDIFNNARPRLITRAVLTNLRELASRPGRTFVFGQSIPRSCRGLSFRLLATVFKRLGGVVVRDEESARRLRSCGVPVELSYDSAFALDSTPATEAAASVAFARTGLIPERTALLSLRGFDPLYPVGEEDFIRRLARLAEILRDRGHQPALLIQADAGPNDGDRAVAARIQSSVPNLPILDAFEPAGGLLGWPLLMGMLARARLVVAVRYHTAVLRLCAGRVPFVLHYANKGEDLARRLRLPNASAGDFDPEGIIDQIEETADRAFDPTPLRRDVRERFQACLAATAGGA